MGRALAAVGVRLASPKPVVLCPWNRSRREHKFASLRRLAASATADEPVFYCDEMDVHLNPEDRARLNASWPSVRRRHARPEQEALRRRSADAATLRMTSVEAGTKASELFCKAVWRLVAEYRAAKRLHLIADNYIIHTSKKTQRSLAQVGAKLVLHFLPPYCPDDNRIERV